MKKQMEQVHEFHEKFKRQINRPDPTLIDDDEALFRTDLMLEEVEEYIEACREQDLVGIADALGDQLYILLGTILHHGLQHKIEEVFDEIHRSNMTKLGADGLPILREDGKIIKGPNYEQPNIEKILK